MDNPEQYNLNNNQTYGGGYNPSNPYNNQNTSYNNPPPQYGHNANNAYGGQGYGPSPSLPSAVLLCTNPPQATSRCSP